MKPYGWIGLLLLLVSGYCLVRKIEPFVTWFYCFAWWSYILLADNLLLKLRGQSLLVHRRKELWGMLPLSIFIWLLFEAYNLVIQNWAYETPASLWQRWSGYAVSFATVLPGIFITADLVERLFGRSTKPPASGSENLQAGARTRIRLASLVPGLILTIAPLVWPRYLFPAVWLGPIFLLNPFLGKMGVAGLFSGSRRRLWSLMLGGLLCGVLWEFWNYWAGSKWIYTIPYFGQWKVFEMPVLGFLGFPPFALECWILYHLLRANLRHMRSMAARIAWWCCLGIVCIMLFRAIDAHTVVRLVETVP